MVAEDNKRILVVDDEPDILAITRVMLLNAGYRVMTADNGLDAVKIVYQEMPDCIVLDVMMPRMNGYQVCRLLKHDNRTRDIPIILCTVKSLEMDRLYGITAGADYYLTKPFEPGDLLKLINESTRRRSERGERPRPLHGEESSTDAILTEINQLLDYKLREYTILQHVSRAISGTLNIDDLLRIILRSTTTDLGFNRGCFLLLDKKGNIEERYIIGEIGDRDPWKGAIDELPGLKNILEKGIPQLIEYRNMEGIVPPDIMNDLHGEVAVVPVVAKGKAQGVILVESANGACNEDTLGFFLTLAGQAGLAIENAQLYSKTLKLSITDGLTGLYNYRYFMERLEAEFTRALRYDREIALFILDIDHFKDYNDRFGHLKGDEALRKMAAILKKNIREVDALARYGGEEFAVILPETGLDEAVIFAERIRKSVAEEWKKMGGMTASIGVAVINQDVRTAEDLIHKADGALYEAKRKGRNRVCHSR